MLLSRKFQNFKEGIGLAYMSATNSAWSAPTHPDIAYRRAGGRRAYNCRRMLIASHRRLEAVLLYFQGNCKHGSQAAAARQLGVHRSFVCRAVKMWREMDRCGGDFRDAENYERIRQKIDKQERRALPE